MSVEYKELFPLLKIFKNERYHEATIKTTQAIVKRFTEENTALIEDMAVTGYLDYLKKEECAFILQNTILKEV